MKKKVLSLGMAALMALSTSSVFAAPNQMLAEDQFQGNSIIESNDEYLIQPLTQDEINQLAEQYGQDPSTIVNAVRIIPNISAPNNQIQEVSPYASSFYLENIEVGPVGGNIFFRDFAVGGDTGAQYTATVKETLSSEMSTEITVKTGWGKSEVATKINARNVISEEFKRDYSIPVPAHRTYAIYGAPNNNYYTFDIYQKSIFGDKFIGHYWYKEPMGIIVWSQDVTDWLE
ncbi:Uncharacterised protein [Chlamydia abortus]|nr:Uncharacterised protein [Chlamydia abortus]